MAAATRTVFISMILVGLARGPQAQVIRLRHPEAGSRLSVGQLASKTQQPMAVEDDGGGGGGGQAAKPGNLIVHFDAGHEIQRVEYKLKDGSLATIFTRDDKQRHSKSTSSIELASDSDGQLESDAAAADDDDSNKKKSAAKSEVAEIVGHVAADALRPHMSLQTAKSAAEKIRAKLAKVPGLIQARLHAKSLRGNTFIERPPKGAPTRQDEPN